MKPLPPYARFLGIERRAAGAEGGSGLVMPFGDHVHGRPGFIHGGAIAGLLELAAMVAVHEALGGEEDVSVKPINVSLVFMRGGRARDTYAAATITRLGKRVANVESHAWQQDRDQPIASAQMNMMIRRRTES